VAVSSSWLVITVITVLAVVQLHVMVADALLSGTQMPPTSQQLLKDQSKDSFDSSNALTRLVPVLPKPRSPPKKGPGANVSPLSPPYALPLPPPFALPPSPLP